MTDDDGTPQIAHVGSVAETVRRLCRPDFGDTVEAAAWLHDVVENTPITLDALRTMDFPEAVVRAVDLLTRREGETYDDYITRIVTAPDSDFRGIALYVKMADLARNLSRCQGSPRHESLKARYEKALKTLSDASSGP